MGDPKIVKLLVLPFSYYVDCESFTKSIERENSIRLKEKKPYEFSSVENVYFCIQNYRPFEETSEIERFMLNYLIKWSDKILFVFDICSSTLDIDTLKSRFIEVKYELRKVSGSLNCYLVGFGEFIQKINLITKKKMCEELLISENPFFKNFFLINKKDSNDVIQFLDNILL